MSKKPIIKLKQYPIRIDKELWREFKGNVGFKGLTMKKVLERLIKLFNSGKIEI